MFHGLPRALSNSWATCLVAAAALVLTACAAPTQPPTPAQPTAAAPQAAPTTAPAAPPASSQATPVPTPRLAPTPVIAGATPTAVSRGPKRGGTLTRAVAVAPPTLDLNFVGSSTVFEIIGLTHNGLFYSDAQLSSVKDLVESWEQPNETTYVFHLKKGVRFFNIPPVNGREITAQDVVTDFKRKRQEFPGLPPMNLVARTWFDPLKSMQATDPYTVTVETKEPYAPFLTYLAHAYTVIFPQESYIGPRGPAYDMTKVAIGTGPFTLTSFTPNVEFTLERNPAYFEKNLPYMDRIRGVIIPDASTRLAAFRAGRVDLVQGDKSQYDAARKTVPNMVAVKRREFHNALFMNPTRKPFDDMRVRQAVSQCMDREALIQFVVDGDGDLAGVPTLRAGYSLPKDELAKLYKRDVAGAKQKLVAAGYPQGFAFKLNATVRQPIAVQNMTVLKDQLKDCGITANIEVLEFPVFLDRREKGDWDAISHGHPPEAEPDRNMVTVYAKGSPYQIDDPELQKLLDQERRITDDKKRAQAVLDLERKALEKSYAAWTYYFYAYVMMSPQVKDYAEPIPTGQHLQRWAWLDR
ncbi:MAG: ABC transporter substrate-binding protein [Chloroflexota bacterium]